MTARRTLLLARLTAWLLSAVTLAAARAAVVRPAPAFVFPSAAGTQSLAKLRGQAVVLLISQTGTKKALRTQLKNLKDVYHDCASRGAVFATALVDGSDHVPSDIPFVRAANGAAVASAYGLRGDFLIAIIGRDGNLDLVTDKPIPGTRILEVIKNNFDVQQKSRREIPKGPLGT